MLSDHQSTRIWVRSPREAAQRCVISVAPFPGFDRKLFYQRPVMIECGFCSPDQLAQMLVPRGFGSWQFGLCWVGRAPSRLVTWIARRFIEVHADLVIGLNGGAEIYLLQPQGPM